MLIDGRALPQSETLATDLCIIGAGPAGIALALACRDRRLKVLLVESGGFAFDPAVQALSQDDSQDLPYELEQMRLRYVGGCSNHWGGFCRPLDPMTFVQRDWVPGSGWPITPLDLAPYYGPAAELCQLGPVQLDLATWRRRLGFAGLPLAAAGALASTVFQISPPTRFGEAYRLPLIQAGNLTVCLNSTCIRLAPAPAGQALAEAEFATLQANRFRVRARAYVLACGGIENARLLLVSNQAEPAGLGNRHDLVGRYFTDHAHFHLGELALADPALARPYLEILPTTGEAGLTLHLELTPAAQRQASLPQAALKLRPGLPSPGERALRSVLTALRLGRQPEHLGRHLLAMLQDPGAVGSELVRLVEHRLRHPPPATGVPATLSLRSVGELVPDRDNRVTLGATRDRFGLPRARLSWRPTAYDRAALGRLGTLVAAEFGRQGLGRVRLAPAEEQRFIDGGWHHIGTTRMADDPTRGVVDRNLKLHGLANLYVAGSSVFPTGGGGAPTLTIVALSLRLAEHLQAALIA